jgi:hypothetical protein
MEGERPLLYEVRWMFDKEAAELRARVIGLLPATAVLQFIVPVIARQNEQIEQPSSQVVRISKSKGTLIVTIDGSNAFQPIRSERAFDLVPGFEAVPLTIAILPGRDVGMRIEAEGA